MAELSSVIPNQEEKGAYKWEWIPCIYDFKQTKDCREIEWNFVPYVMLSSDDSSVNF